MKKGTLANDLPTLAIVVQRYTRSQGGRHVGARISGRADINVGARPRLDVVYSDGIIFGDGPDVGRRLMEAFSSYEAIMFESVVKAESRC